MNISKSKLTSAIAYIVGVLSPIIVKYCGFTIDTTIITSIIVFIVMVISESHPRVLKVVDDEASLSSKDDDGGC